MKNFFCTGVLSLIFTIVLSPSGHAQYKALKVGDKVPEAFWTTRLEVVNHPQQSIDLSADRGKLIILDFWNIWCSACLLNFPRMEAFQQQFEGKVKILAVSQQDRPTLEKFFASKNGQRYKSTLSVAGDKMMHDFFPHLGVPFMIWIKDGKVVSTTGADQVSEKTISELIDNKASSLQKVIQMSKDRPLMMSENMDLEKAASLSAYSFLTKGRLRAYNYGSGYHFENAVIRGRMFTNLSLMEILFAIGVEIFKANGDSFNEKRVVVDVKKRKGLGHLASEGIEDDEKNLYSYDYMVPVEQVPSLYPMMLANINQFIDYEAVIEKRLVKAYVLKRTSGGVIANSQGGAMRCLLSEEQTILQNCSFSNFVNALSSMPAMVLPLVDETGYVGSVDLKMRRIKDLKSLQQELSRHHLEMVEAERSINMLVIRDKKNTIKQ